VLLQEHWLLPKEIDYLNHIDKEFLAIGSSTVNVGNGLLIGRPYGGTAIMYRRSLAP